MLTSTEIEAIHPPCTARWNPRGRSPIDRVQVERPRSPSGASPVFRASCLASTAAAYHHGVSGAAFFDLDRTLLAGASGEVFSDGDARGRASRRAAIPGEKAAVRAVQPHRRDAAVDGPRPPGAPASPRAARRRRCRPPARPPPRRWRRWSSRSPAGCSTSTAPPAARSCWPRPRPTTSSSRSPTGSASTTSSPPATASTPTAPTTARSTGRSCGPPASSPPSATGPTTHDVDLAESYAYSDSVYDTPLLSAVGTRSSSTPTRGWSLMALLRRWPILNLDVSPGVVKIPVLGIELQRLAMQFSRPELMPYARFDIAGVEHIPAAGPAILVANHRSYFDSAAMSMAIARSGRTVRFLGKKEVFDAPVVGQLATAMGGIRVDRGTGSDEPLQAAADALDGGEVVAIMPQGTIPRGPAFFDPELKGRWGAARLAALTKAPVIPIGLWGTEKVWPRSSRLPNVLNVADPPQVTVRVGAPVDAQAPLARRRHEADHGGDQRPAARTRRTSSTSRRAEELAATLPARLQGRPDRRVDAPPGHGLLSEASDERAHTAPDRRRRGRARRPARAARAAPAGRSGRRSTTGRRASRWPTSRSCARTGPTATTGGGSRPSSTASSSCASCPTSARPTASASRCSTPRRRTPARCRSC